MDAAWNNPPPKGTLPCILCKSVISFPNKDKKKYFKHMKKDHGAFYNINLILIINLLERKQILKLIANIKSGESDEKKKTVTANAEVQTDAPYEPAAAYYSGADEDIVVVDSGFPVPKPMLMPGIANTSDDVNAQIEEIRRFLGQISDETGKTDSYNNESYNDESMDISDENPTVTNNIEHGFELQVPNDLELEEAIPMSTPKQDKNQRRMKKEFIEPDPSQDPMEVMLEGEEEFNILDVTNDDLVLTAAGPQHIEDYTSFIPGAVIPPSYNPSEVLDESNVDVDDQTASDSPDVNPIHNPSNVSNDGRDNLEKSGQEETMKNVQNIENLVEKKTKKDMLTIYLQNCSEYFRKFPKQISSCTQERALRFVDTDPNLPEGWKIQTFDRKTGKSTGRRDKEFLSPEMKVFRSKIAVLEYMKAMGGYSEEEMFKVLPINVKKERM